MKNQLVTSSAKNYEAEKVFNPFMLSAIRNLGLPYR